MPPDPDPDLLSALTAYYDQTDSEIIERLAREAEARRIYQPIKQFLGKAYAGAWFDGDTLELVVALTDYELAVLVQEFGGRPVLVERNLDELEAIKRRVGTEAAADPNLSGSIMARYVDYLTNRVVVEVPARRWSEVQAWLDELPVDPSAGELRASKGVPRLANEIRGADCYENTAFTELNDGEPFWCSMGFAVAGGFITAGHCGRVNDPVSSCNGASVGVFRGSTWFEPPTGDVDNDRGWVETDSPWQPVPKVNGYNDGILSVSAASGGYVEAPLQSTVCRYGQKTKGPHCGQILAKNQSQPFCVNKSCTQTVTLEGITKTDACVGSGDSGGSFITGDGQAQGTTIGGVVGTCGEPEPSESWFEPVAGTLEEFNRILLTTHGSKPPEITIFVCPDLASSGAGAYFCNMAYDTQGPTLIQWTTNTGHTSDGRFLIGGCLEHQTVNVDLLVTNNYGSDSRTASFMCPTNDPQ